MWFPPSITEVEDDFFKIETAVPYSTVFVEIFKQLSFKTMSSDGHSIH